MHVLRIHIAHVEHWSHIIVSLELFPGSKRHRTSVPSSSNVFLCFNIWAGEGLDSVFVVCCFLFLVEWNVSSLL